MEQKKGAPRIKNVTAECVPQPHFTIMGSDQNRLGIYMVIRFSPSLAPPLWPAIPANLAIP